MTNSVGFQMQPAEVTDATKHLDALAARIEKLMAAESANLAVSAPGRDEVSRRVAGTLNDVRTGFTASASQGATELREVAATLRRHTEHIVAAENDFTV